MDELLTVKEVQNLLRVERLTVYRMLKDGRLAGVKIGHQWRFPRTEVTSLINHTGSSQHEGRAGARATQALPIPLACAQLIQDMFAEITNIGVVTTGPQGEQLTEISNSCRFCTLMRSTEKGRQRCAAFWRELRETNDAKPFARCPAGLSYARVPLDWSSEPEAMIAAGQFYDHEPDPTEERMRITRLAVENGIEPGELAMAACSLRTLDEQSQQQLTGWLKSLAATFEHISTERADLMGRLQMIAAMTHVES